MKFKPSRKMKYTDEELQLLLHLRRKTIEKDLHS